MPSDQPTFAQVLSRWRGENVAYDLAPYRELARTVARAAEPLRHTTDAEILSAARALRGRAAGLDPGPGPLEPLLVEAYGLVLEAARRELGLVAFEEQLAAAVVVHRGGVVEMGTGEGKTFAAVFPASLSALTGRGVHVLTTNDYLARRDAAWMGPVYARLGLGVGLVQAASDRAARAAAYAADVTYGTLAEVGFDLLRDGLALAGSEIVVRRPLHHAILDDVDSTLIDEARHALVVAGEEPDAEDDGGRVDRAVCELRADRDVGLDEHGERAFLTEDGVARVESALGCEDLFAPERLELLTRVNLAVHAHFALRRDVDYLVRSGRIELIDAVRGRVAEGRRLPDGIHAALEEKEALARTGASRVLVQTTLQAVARLYSRLSGMTGTAREAAEELGALYGMEVVLVPPHRPCIREDYIDLVFTHTEARDSAVLAEIEELHAEGRPVLVGTDSVEASDALAAALAARGIRTRVLNARNDEQEAEIVAEAGARGAVTVSTRMAGRGTDIPLGGGDGRERAAVAALGGLAVLGTRRSEGERLDDQLRGRAGRQGDPGSSQLFVSLDDDIFVRYGVRELLPAKYRDARLDEPLLDRKVLAEVDRAQRIIAAHRAGARKTLWGYDSFVERQRRLVQGRRRRTLFGQAESVVEAVAPEAWAEMGRRVGPERRAGIERRLALGWIDRAWSDHLARLTEAREQVQLMTAGVTIGSNFGRERPMGTFHRLARESFETFEEEVDSGVVESFERALERGRVDLDAEGLAPPRRTWTYAVEEQPLRTKPPPRLQATMLRSLLDLLTGKKRPERNDG